MKQNSTKSLKWLTAVTVSCGAIYLVMIGFQTFALFSNSPHLQKADWQDDIRILQGSIAIFRFLGAAGSLACLTAFLINSVKALNNGILFPRRNIGILFYTAASTFVFMVCDSNIQILFGSRSINLGYFEILVPVVICAFAIIYRVAVRISEENSLTI